MHRNRSARKKCTFCRQFRSHHFTHGSAVRRQLNGTHKYDDDNRMQPSKTQSWSRLHRGHLPKKSCRCACNGWLDFSFKFHHLTMPNCFVHSLNVVRGSNMGISKRKKHQQNRPKKNGWKARSSTENCVRSEWLRWILSDSFFRGFTHKNTWMKHWWSFLLCLPFGLVDVRVCRFQDCTKCWCAYTCQ